MKHPLKIGFLIPDSGVYPFYAQHIMIGIWCAITKLSFTQQDFVFIPVPTADGSRINTVKAVKKLLFAEEVDVISGMVNIRAIHELRPLLESMRIPGLFFDFGELIPPKEGFGPYISNISMNLWQSQYILGQWAVSEFGKNGHIVSPVYEAGFNLTNSFLQGAASAGATALRNFIIPEENQGRKNTLNLEAFFETIDKESPAFVHAIFLGKPGNSFLQQWKASKFYNSIPLITIENMAYKDILKEVSHLDLQFYSASSWQRDTEHPVNKKFVDHFEDFGKQEANLFGLMGFEAGLVFADMLTDVWKGEAPGFSNLFVKGETKLTGPLNFYFRSSRQFSLIDVNKIVTSRSSVQQSVVTQSTAIGFDISQIYQDNLNGWQNPYLSIQ